MRAFFETTFGPTELSIVEAVFKQWLSEGGITRDAPEAELAAAIVINLFREGHNTGEALRAAVVEHKGLADLKAVASFDDMQSSSLAR